MTKKTTAKKTPAPQVVFLPGIFNDTVNLLLESYEYFQQNGVEDQVQLAPAKRTAYTKEMSRISMRLSTIMAWLMIRKAVFQGKLTPKEADEQFQFDSKEICLSQNIEAEHMLPKPMNALLHESLQLYERVLRLDESLESVPSPLPKKQKKKPVSKNKKKPK